MKYLLCAILAVIGFGTAGPPLYYTHTLPLVPACIAGAAFSFMAYLFDPTQFLAFSADMRKNATAWFTKKDGENG